MPEPRAATILKAQPLETKLRHIDYRTLARRTQRLATNPRCACGAYLSRYNPDPICAPCLEAQR